jgi:hypothetical protein
MLGNARRLMDGIIVCAGNAHYLRSEARDRRDARVAYASMDEDDRPGANELRALRDRPSVIAVRRAGEGHRLCDLAHVVA